MSKQRGYNAPHPIIIIGIISLIGSVAMLAYGKKSVVQHTIPSNSYSIPAFKGVSSIKAYTFIDPAGRVCTGVIIPGNSSWGDCDFPPSGVEFKISAE